eukprot:CAMPEP_0198732666 /NCGR_PEP_ID=MMETSP1475-20131203/37809_1 /TAXON_ID= ORGANISM="Unidentified sp., Strain CCMP1999" /NCGR_SAMPLE_ID=MMETSP1475 /ASSEMBLY_ACC=CAM_ASM_001111 /LENGTH=225 /DNA_ID=CAMNT_0044495809 /DNA_START=298 /DNA_END=975 /DNA_ORIENTATION=-
MSNGADEKKEKKMSVSALLTKDEEPADDARRRLSIGNLVDDGSGAGGEAEESSEIKDLSAGPSNPLAAEEVIKTHKKKRRNRMFLCDLCSGSFTTRRDLETHVRTVHEKLRPHKCAHCDAHFGTKSNLNTHTKSVHEGKRPFPCEVCNVAFKTRGNLETHVLTVHEQKRPFKCDFCQATFGTKSVMNRHVRIVHERDEGHKCDVCQEVFDSAEALSAHAVVHRSK